MELKDQDNSSPLTLASVGRKVPFAVPEFYFDELNASIQSRIRIEQARFSEEEEFSIPKGYFKHLAERIEDRLITENLPAKTGNGGFAVPAGYLDHLSSQLTDKVAQEKTVRSTPKILKSWISYAAAACVTIAIGTAVLVNSGSSFQVDQKLSEVPDQDIINYLQVHGTASDTPVIIEYLDNHEFDAVHDDVSEEELENYLNTTTL